MRIHFETFDCIWGILVGIVLIGLAGVFFALPNIPILWGIFFIVSAVTTIIDVVMCVKDFHDMHKILLACIFVSSIIYFIVELAMVSKYLNVAIPFITQTVLPVISQSTTLMYIGVFFIISSIIWLIDTHKG
ncbi:MAG: hypothetical protein ABIA21_03125 [Candidatus Aenigmatarchaeota archaeon]